MKDAILKHLPPDFPWADRILYIPVLASTNDTLKQLGCEGAPHGTALIAGSQTGGRGRMGRSFHSPEGAGIYMSILLRPGCAPAELMHLTCAAAVAMCDAVEKSVGFRPGIKWTNDLVWGKRKLGGILTELRLAPHGAVDFAIIGVGLNCCQKAGDFPEALQDTAASLSMASGQTAEPARVAAAMLDAFARMDNRLLSHKTALLDRYRTDCITLGQEISILRGEDVRHGTALGVDDDGGLVVAYSDGTTATVSSGEVSVRGMYGYI